MIRRQNRKEAAARKLAEEHIGLVFHWVGKCKQRKIYQEVDAEELVQEGYFGLIRAAQKYNPSKGQFTTYATKWIRKYIRKFRLRSRKAGCVSCDSRRIDNLDIAASGAAGAITKGDALDSAIDSETASAIAGAVGDLDARARDIVLSRFSIVGARETYKALAKRHGISTTRVRQIEKRTLEKLRKSKYLTHFHP